MPTENRSSSKHGTRTFTLDSLTAALDQVQALHEISADLIAENVFGQPAQQGQGEPVALAIPDECPHLIVFDDTEVESLMFAGAGARWAALESWKTISTSWNAHLFVRVARNSRDDRHPCATVADPAEVERLRADYEHAFNSGEIARSECDALRAELSQCEAMALMVAEREWAEHVGRGPVSGKVEKAFTQLHNDLHEAQEKLAEAHALLEEAYQHDIGTPLKRKMRALNAALPASAEPSAPECLTCKGSGLDYDNGIAIPCTDCWEVFQARAALALERKP